MRSITRLVAASPWLVPLGLLLTVMTGCSAAGQSECADGQTLDEVDGDDLGCVPEACGAGPYGVGDDGDLHVAPWGDDGGDGSVDSPFSRVRDAVRVAGEHGGGVVRVAAGSYSENLQIDGSHDRVELTGRCSELTTLDASEGDELPGVNVVGGRFTLREFTVFGALAQGILLNPGNGEPDVQFTGSGLLLERNTLIGFMAVSSEAEATVDDMTVRLTQPSPETGSFGRGIDLTLGARMTASRILIEENFSRGVFVGSNGSRLDLSDAVIREMQPLPGRGEGVGIDVNAGGQLNATDVVLQDCISIGIIARDTNTRVELVDVSVTDTVPHPDGQNGRGIEVREGALLIGTRVTVDGASNNGIRVAQAGARVELTDSVVSNTQMYPDGLFGRGIEVMGGSSLLATGLLLHGNRDAGLLVTDAGSTAELIDSEVRDSLPVGDGTNGIGIAVRDGASFQGSGLLVTGNRMRGISTSAPGTAAVVTNSVISGNLAAATGVDGAGLAVGTASSFTGTDLLIQGNAGAGVVVLDPGSLATLDDVTVGGNLSIKNAFPGQGVILQGGAELLATRLLIEDNEGSGLSISGAGSAATLLDCVVRDTMPSLVVGVTNGIAVLEGGSLTATGLEVVGNTGVGLIAEDVGTTVDLVDATIGAGRPELDGSAGRGVHVIFGAQFSGQDVVIENNMDVGLLVALDGSHGKLSGGRVSGTQGSPISLGAALAVQLEGSLVANGVEISENEGPGVYAFVGGDARLTGCELRENGFAGAAILGGSFELSGSTVSGSRFHPSEGGGHGVFSFDLYGPSLVTIESSTFSDLVGPALYARGEGRYVFRDNAVRASGVWPSLPGGVLAVEGTVRWDEAGGPQNEGVGMLIAGNAFDDMNADGVLLDGSSATLATDPSTGAPNTYSGVRGEDLYAHCAGTAEPADVLDGSSVDASCRETPRPLGPLTNYSLRVQESAPVE